MRATTYGATQKRIAQSSTLSVTTVHPGGEHHHTVTHLPSFDHIHRHSEIPSHRLLDGGVPRPVLDCSYLDIETPEHLMRVKQRGGKEIRTRMHRRAKRLALLVAMKPTLVVAELSKKKGSVGKGLFHETDDVDDDDEEQWSEFLHGLMSGQPAEHEKQETCCSGGALLLPKFLFSIEMENYYNPQRLIVVKSKDTTYAFKENQDQPRNVHAQLLSAKELQDKAEEELLTFGLIGRAAFDTTQCNLSHNLFNKMDAMLTRALASLIWNSLRKLDLSHNKIQTISTDFLALTKEELIQRDPKLCLPTANGKCQTAFLACHAHSRVLVSLQSLLLHENNIRSLEEVYNLSPLRHSLRQLTINNNPQLDLALQNGSCRSALMKHFYLLHSFNFSVVCRES